MLSENASTQVGNGTQEAILGDTELKIKREKTPPIHKQISLLSTGAEVEGLDLY